MTKHELTEKDLEDAKPHIIPLLNLENISPGEDYYFDKIYKIVKKGNDSEKELLNKFEKDCIELHYKIDPQKEKEIESVFKQVKLFIKFNQEPQLLKDGILYTPSGSFYIYNKKSFKKLFALEIEEGYNISHAIQLKNKDLILIIEPPRFYCIDYKMLIFRYSNGKVNLIQTIEEDSDGFPDKYAFSGGCGNSYHLVGYYIYFLKEISNNRFICVSNYGFKLYSLNKNNNEYSLILLDNNLEGIKFIHEINENKFMFGVKIKKEREYFEEYFSIAFKIVELKKITQSEIEYKIKNKKENDWAELNRFNCYHLGPTKEDDIDKKMVKAIEIITKLQLTCSIKTIFETDNKAVFPNLKENIILKNKYLIFMMDVTINILDLSQQKIIKKYKIFINDENQTIIYRKMILRKWSCKDDNEFILIICGNVILFELKEEKDDIKIVLINKAYFPLGQNDKIIVRKINEEDNIFYIHNKKIETNVIVEDQNEETTISIY